MFMEVFLLSGVVSGALTVGASKHYKNTNKTLKQKLMITNTQKNAVTKSIKRTDFSEKKVNRHLALSLISLPLLKIPYYPLQLAVIPVVIYSSTLYFKRSFVLLKQGRTATGVMDLIGLSGIMLTGQFFAFSLSCALYLISLRLLIKTEDHSTQNLVGFLKEQPRFVWVCQDDLEIKTPIESVKVGDIIVVHAGETVPVDGVIMEGMASINQHNLTGESQPVEKEVNDQVFALTTVLAGRVWVEVENAGSNTVAANVARILTNTTDFKEAMQSKGEKMVDKGATPTLIAAALALPIGVQSSLSALNAGFGYQMRVAAPISVLNFLHIASRNGCLIKDGRSLELLEEIDTVVFDKTGTLTQEQPFIKNIHAYHGHSQENVLSYAATAEYKQTHPIAKAILEEARKRQLNLTAIEDAKYEVGYGMQVSIPDPETTQRLSIHVGSSRFMEMQNIVIPEQVSELQSQCQEAGYSLIYVALDNTLIGVIELHATIRPEAKELVQELRDRNLDIYILSGDHKQPTRTLANELGIKNYFAEVLPENKAEVIEQLQAEGRKVCFVGDGINDSIALKKANVSISLSGASSIAMDSAAIILMDGNLAKLPKLFDISKDFSSNLQNGFNISVASGVICIGGVFFMGWGLVSSILLYNASRVVSVSNSILPLLSKKKQ